MDRLVMLRLYLIRHAKSSWKDTTIKDFDRPLNKRGKRDAPIMADFMASKFHKPDILLSSPAERAHRTALIFAEHWKTRLKLIPEIYMANPMQLVRILKSQEAYNSIAIIGHNPGLLEFCEFITTTRLENIATSAVAVIDLNIESWRRISESSGKLISYQAPKFIKNT